MEIADKRISDLEELLKIQCSNGNWDYNPYMMGMANGMILAMATIKNEEPKFMEAPKVWLKDLPDDGTAPLATV